MRIIFTILLFVISISSYSQNITVDSQSFTPQQLVEDILIDSNCISNIQVTNVVGGDFSGQDQSYGYFNANGSGFPLREGIVLSTGRLQNVQGPNTTLSDDDAPGWNGDSDLEIVLEETNTTNATILEFTFQSTASEVRFRYLFASEEYQEGNANTCRFSDLFGFLIREEGTQTYENIALVPGTETPVKVTTVHPEIPGGCDAINEFFFESFNGNVAPINFNGQTKVIEAEAIIQPNVNYQVKLVIADEQNFRFDSAVFLEAGSFQLGTDIGENRTVSGGNPVCGDEGVTLSANEPTASSFSWFRDGNLLIETSNELEVTEDGFYEVIVDLQNNCQAFGEVSIEFVDAPLVFDSILSQCDANDDGITEYNLFDASSDLTGNSAIRITGFYESIEQAESEIDPIVNPEEYTNDIPGQVVFAVIVAQTGCSSIAQLELVTSNLPIIIEDLAVCDDEIIDGITFIDLNEVTNQFQNQIPTDASVDYYLSEEDAFNQENNLDGNFTNTIPNEQTLYVRVSSEGQCISIASVRIIVLSPPFLEEDEEVIYCVTTFPNTIILQSGVNGDTTNFDYQWSFNGIDIPFNTPTIEVNEIGFYTVTVTNQNDCFSSRTISVIPSSIPVITNISSTGASQNGTVTVVAEGEGDYEYAIDNILGPYQDSPVFENISPGFYNVFVRDKNGCGTAVGEVSVIGFPEFFTPNGDGVNDYWKLEGATDEINPTRRFIIFDRFGKLLHQAVTVEEGWNGVFNGKILPASDYWYLVELEGGQTFKGHFSLVR